MKLDMDHRIIESIPISMAEGAGSPCWAWRGSWRVSRLGAFFRWLGLGSGLDFAFSSFGGACFSLAHLLLEDLLFSPR